VPVELPGHESDDRYGDGGHHLPREPEHLAGNPTAKQVAGMVKNSALPYRRQVNGSTAQGRRSRTERFEQGS
jgi:hypothetical protein